MENQNHPEARRLKRCCAHKLKNIKLVLIIADAHHVSAEKDSICDGMRVQSHIWHKHILQKAQIILNYIISEELFGSLVQLKLA